MQISGAIFDLDGTLIDTLPIVLKSLRKALADFGSRSFTDEQITAAFGPNETGLAQRLMPEHWQEGLRAYLSEYQRLMTEENLGPFPGILEALELLKERGIRMGIVTGKGGSTAFTLKQAGIDGYFDPVMTGSADGPIKPGLIEEILDRWSIDPEAAFYIGDSPSDVQDARQVGVIPLGAAWADPSQRELLAAQDPHTVFASTQGFIDWIIAKAA